MGQAALVILALAGSASVTALCAQEAPTTNSPSGQVVTAYLDYQEVSHGFMIWSLPMVQKSSPFKKEPPFSKGRVVRGTWQLGRSASDEVAFAWGRGARKLYVDLNRNLDLTDDPGGVFSTETRSGDMFQSFHNVRLPAGRQAGGRQMLVDLSFSDYAGLNCSASVRSFWQGKVILQGKEWQAGLLGTPFDQRASFEGGHLLLRPWAERHRSFSLYDGTLAALPFSRKLFLGERAYQLQCTNDLPGVATKVRMVFTEQSPKLGELKIPGAYVQRATLEGGPYLVILDQPGATVKVPVGPYKGGGVCLKRGDVEAHLERNSGEGMGKITVTEEAPAVLRAGGPLTNSVSMSRRGKNLSLSYRLLGIGGPYQLVSQDRAHPPEFTIYQGDKKVASGKFEFG